MEPLYPAHGSRPVEQLRIEPPETHAWRDSGYGWGVCVVCCKVKRADGKNKPCAGPGRLSVFR